MADASGNPAAGASGNPAAGASANATAGASASAAGSAAGRAGGDRAGAVAVVDIGTNTLLLLIANRAGGHACDQVVARREACRFGRLGQGLDRTGSLAPEAIDRSLAILREYRRVIDDEGVSRVAAVGTQALREASNAAAFTTPARHILGADIEIIAGEREAQLVYTSVARSFPDLAGSPFVIVDVGGGSTEVIAAAPDGQVHMTSLPIGSVRMTERHLASDPPRASEVQALFADIDRALGSVTIPAGASVIGTAGTATTMASLHLALRRYDPDRIHGAVLPVGAIERQLARLFELTVDERRQLAGMEPERADVIAAGAAIFARVLDRAGAGGMRVSDRGVRWGLAHELLDGPG